MHAHDKEFRRHGGRTLVHSLITRCTRCHGLVRMTPGGRTAGSYARLVGLPAGAHAGAHSTAHIDAPNVRRVTSRAYRTS